MPRISIVAICLTLLAAAAVAAETPKPPLSPPAKAEANVGSAAISIDYAAPSMRGRAIMGELVPFGKVWRTGANAATTFRTSADLMIGDLHVPAGTYTLYTIPSETEWTLIVSRQTGQWGSRYDESQDLGRVTMSVSRLDSPVEVFAISIRPVGPVGTLALTWENMEATVPLTVR
jgi:hypothetical protein